MSPIECYSNIVKALYGFGTLKYEICSTQSKALVDFQFFLLKIFKVKKLFNFKSKRESPFLHILEYIGIFSIETLNSLKSLIIIIVLL